MLNHIIYTRCIAYRDLLGNGEQKKNEGFSVFSMNRELFSDNRIRSFNLLNVRLALKNASMEDKPIGLFNSYEYFELDKDVYALTFEFSRPRGTVPRTNGSTHRAGNFTKECLIGRGEGYPYNWFGSSVWKAHLRSENSYYLDEIGAVVPWLEPVSEKCIPGKYTEEDIRAFINDGRGDCVRAAVCYLIKEYEKPIEQRRPLLIKDIPENVEKWIAAVELFFPVELAKKITFTTNRSKMGIQIDPALFYYQDRNGNFLFMNNPGAKRIPYCMIVGYHPEDEYSKNIRQVAHSNFRIIDGTNRTSGIEPDSDADRSYFMDCVRRTEDARIYTKYFLPCLPFSELSMKITDLYVAYKYLFDEDNMGDRWEYKEAMTHLRCFDEILGGPQKCVRFSEDAEKIVNQLFGNMKKLFEKSAEEDQKNGYVLLSLMLKYAAALKKEREVSAMVSNLFTAYLGSLPASSERLSSLWKALSEPETRTMLADALRIVFGDEKLRSYSSAVNNMNCAGIDTLMRMYSDFCRISGKKIVNYSDLSPDYQLVKQAATVSMKKGGPDAALTILNNFSDSPTMHSRLLLDIADELEGTPEKQNVWWGMILTSDKISIEEICIELCRSKETDIDSIERLLIQYLSRNGSREEAERAFTNSMSSLGRKENTGVDFFKYRIANIKYGECAEIIRTIQKLKLLKPAQTELFRLIDERSIYNPKFRQELRTCRSEMESWGGRLKLSPNGLAFSDFVTAFTSAINKKKKINLLLEYLDDDYKFTVQKSFFDSDLFSDLSRRTSKEEDPELHLYFMLLFDVSNSKDDLLQYYADSYVFAAAGNYNKKTMSMLASIIEASLQGGKNPGKKPKTFQNTKECMRRAVEEYIYRNYKDSMFDDAKNLKDYRVDVKNYLEEYIRGAAADPANRSKKGDFPQKLKNTFGSFLGRKKY